MFLVTAGFHPVSCHHRHVPEGDVFHSVSGQPFYDGHFLMDLSKLKRKAVGISRLLVSDHYDWEMTVANFCLSLC